MEDGILLIDKPAGVTCRHIDNCMQRLFHTRKVGHLGTLDPFATGLLVVAINKGNKCMSYIGDEKKSYVATLRLGYRSSTGDTEGEIKKLEVEPNITKEEAVNALNSFLGKGEQIPPMTSAIKVDGKALYELAHKGVEVERKARPIEVFSIKLLSLEGDIITFWVEVSKGTYIRTLGEDIAKKLGSEGYLTSLRRTSVGDISVEKAIPFEQIKTEDLLEPTPFISLPHVDMSEARYKMVLNGVKQTINSEEPTILFCYKDVAVAVYQKEDDGFYHSVRGLF